MAAATPWNRRRSPKALVSFSNPKRSTTRIDRREANTAGKYNRHLWKNYLPKLLKFFDNGLKRILKHKRSIVSCFIF